MTGGKTNNKTKSGASLTEGKPGMSASATPATTNNMAGGTSSLAASTEIAAITASSEIRISIVGSIVTPTFGRAAAASGAADRACPDACPDASATPAPAAAAPEA